MTELYSLHCDCGDDAWQVYVYDNDTKYLSNYLRMHEGHNYTTEVVTV